MDCIQWQSQTQSAIGESLRGEREMEFLNLKHSHIIYRETVIDTATLTSCSQQLSHFIIIAIFRFHSALTYICGAAATLLMMMMKMLTQTRTV